MAQTITVGIKQLLEEARKEINEISASEAIELHQNPDVQLVDIRDVRELEREGRVPGAYHCPRGMLEFWIDPESPYHKEVFAADKTFMFMCAGGLRSAFATQIAQRMGLKPVVNVIGGFGAWRKAEGPIEQFTRPPWQETKKKDGNG